MMNIISKFTGYKDAFTGMARKTDDNIESDWFDRRATLKEKKLIKIENRQSRATRNLVNKKRLIEVQIQDLDRRNATIGSIVAERSLLERKLDDDERHAAAARKQQILQLNQEIEKLNQLIKKKEAPFDYKRKKLENKCKTERQNYEHGVNRYYISKEKEAESYAI